MSRDKPRKIGIFPSILGKGPPMGQRHPLRNQFSGFYQGRPDLSGTPEFSRDWMKLSPQGKRFTGLKTAETKKNKRDGGQGGRGDAATAPIMFNMFTQTENRQVSNVTNNNYMGGRGFVDDGEPDWGTPGGEFQDAEFETMDHDLYNVRESPGGGNWENPAGEIGTGDGQDALGI